MHMFQKTKISSPMRTLLLMLLVVLMAATGSLSLRFFLASVRRNQVMEPRHARRTMGDYEAAGDYENAPEPEEDYENAPEPGEDYENEPEAVDLESENAPVALEYEYALKTEEDLEDLVYDEGVPETEEDLGDEGSPEIPGLIRRASYNRIVGQRRQEADDDQDGEQRRRSIYGY